MAREPVPSNLIEVVACGARPSDTSSQRGHRTITVHSKGGEDQTLALAPVAGDALDAYLDTRTDGHAPLFSGGVRQRRRTRG